MNKIGRKSIYVMLVTILTFLIVLPIITVFVEAVIVDGRLDFSNMAQIIFKAENITTIMNSLLLAVLVVIVSTMIATPLAFILV